MTAERIARKALRVIEKHQRQCEADKLTLIERLTAQDGIMDGVLATAQRIEREMKGAKKARQGAYKRIEKLEKWKTAMKSERKTRAVAHKAESRWRMALLGGVAAALGTALAAHLL